MTASYKGWPNCRVLSNGLVDLVATTDVGPRIIRFGFKGGPNEFQEFDEQIGLTGGSEWRIYGGHRLWHAPEARPRSYAPDNAPVEAVELEGALKLVQPLEPATGIQKSIIIRLDPHAAAVTVTHRLKNLNPWTVELAPWALTVMAAGGRAVIPFPPRGSHPQDLLPASLLVSWAYTDMSDPRWTWGRKYFMLRQDSASTAPQKIGAMVPDGWAAYAREGHLFVKTFTPVPGATYPDYGCSVETFTNKRMLELETLAPLARLAPGETAEHVENWFLFQGIPEPKTDDDVDAHILSQLSGLSGMRQAGEMGLSSEQGFGITSGTAPE